ncbi:glycosyltransferase family 4 protein [Erwinia phyllosphaerae]|uniref:glycosyltransferase family 4 protein n=1 Tax=Erwinia phyllosphaerae TaxID=2853256 RepID=UPI001FF01697|nr:glycosyltransferase family 4 protein [Erwinia phyllosphaerae]MBV4368061.1 glycosyltransferase family 4 protein [Erwinia phyllosphaerae]
MRIAYICADAGIPVFGCKGASVHVQEILRAFLRKGAEIVLFARRIGTPPADLRAIPVVQLDPLPAGDAQVRSAAALAANPQLENALKAEGPFDLVYERYSLWSFAGITYACQRGWRTVLEVNAPLIEEQRKYRKLVAEEAAVKVLQNLLASAAAVIAVSPGVKRYLGGFTSSPERIHIIANGVDPRRFASASAHPQVHADTTVIGFLGTLKPWHGLEHLLTAFALLQAQRPQTSLLIIGDGPERKLLQDEAMRLGLNNVVFTGAVSPTRVAEWLARTDIAVAPYPRLEQFYFSPLKIYEYMAAALPVVTTRVGHLADVVAEGHTGMLAAPDDPEALCEALLTLVDDPVMRQRLGKNARRYVMHNHSWDSVAEEILRIVDLSNGSMP